MGGLTAFGFVGLFIGPVVLAIGLAVWREWISQHKNELFAQQEGMLVDGPLQPKMAEQKATEQNKDENTVSTDQTEG